MFIDAQISWAWVMVEGDEGGAGGEVAAVDVVAVEAEEALPSFMAHHLYPSTRCRMTFSEATAVKSIITTSAHKSSFIIHSHIHKHIQIFHLAVAV